MPSGALAELPSWNCLLHDKRRHASHDGKRVEFVGANHSSTGIENPVINEESVIGLEIGQSAAGPLNVVADLG
jgi:hypothetical protein